MAKLKVYRTPAGFYDAYVAAPSQKAALAAWGSDANLFARGLAEIVSDPEQTAEPLANPGVVIRRMRTAADEPEVAPPKRPRRTATAPAPKRAPRPKPSRAALDAAESAIEEAETRQAEERRAQKRAEEALAAKGRALNKAHAEERTRLDRVRIAAREDYEAALEAWRAD